MSTAALSAPHLEVAAPDTMDLHSDGGFDFGDGDIDIDLDQRSTGGLDDDVSLRDAATDAGLDAQTVPGDQDDFMADNEDLIEEDVDEDVEVDIQHSAGPTIAQEQPEPVDLEEDLIDYSDDDEDVGLSGEAPVATDADEDGNRDVYPTAKNNEDNSGLNALSHSSDHAEGDMPASQDATDAYEGQGASALVQEQQPSTTQPPDEELIPQEQEHDPSQYDVHVDQDTAGKDSGILESSTSEPDVVSSTATGVENPSIEQSGHDGQDDDPHPVNVNFNGHDYWLLKQHDYEGSGDYLLEDASFMKTPLHLVIEACREALGSLDVYVSGDLELGFRLDSLRGVELYQDVSTCACFSLEHILRVYLDLHAQDGVADPDYLCITLVTRPRLASLLTELSRASAEGIGFSGLEQAIASGQTAFSAQYPYDSAEQTYGDWEQDDEQESAESPEALEALNKSQADERNDDQAEEQQHYQGEDSYEAHEEEHGKDEHQERDDVQTSEITANTIDDKATVTVAASDNELVKNATTSADGDVKQSNDNTVTSGQKPQGPGDDLIDYSDDEFEDDAPVNEAQTSRATSASATVQGDEPPPTQGNLEDTTQDDQQDDQDRREKDRETTHDDAEDTGTGNSAEYEGQYYPYGEYEDQAYGETYDGEYGQEYNEGQDFGGYPAYNVAQTNDENTNYLGELEQQLTGDADDLRVTPELNVGELDAVDDTFEGDDGILEFDEAAAPPQSSINEHAAEDEIDYSDGEDGADGQAPVAASAAADTVATSSSGLQNLSPQGQKRTIDEVGNDVVDATTSTDAKRPRV